MIAYTITEAEAVELHESGYWSSLAISAGKTTTAHFKVSGGSRSMQVALDVPICGQCDGVLSGGYCADCEEHDEALAPVTRISPTEVMA